MVGEIVKNSVLKRLVLGLCNHGCLEFLGDKNVTKIVYSLKSDEKMDWNYPVTFNQKLQWLKIHDHNPVYTQLVDKIKAKEIVGSIIGNEHIVPMYGSWDKAEVDSFLSTSGKSFHTDARQVNFAHRLWISTTNKWGSNAEETGTRIQAKDYKFYCFNGEPKFLYVGQGLTCDHSLKIDYFDLDWNIMPFYRTDYDRLGSVTKPQQLEQMIEIATKLSEGFPFVRIDLFEIDDVVYFSEFSPCPASGYMPFVPNEYDRIVGSWLKLQEYDKKNKNYVDFV